jgi:hypothetical protein
MATSSAPPGNKGKPNAASQKVCGMTPLKLRAQGNVPSLLPKFLPAGELALRVRYPTVHSFILAKATHENRWQKNG